MATTKTPTPTPTRVINAFAAYEAGAPVKPYQYEAKPLGPLDVEVKIRFCGICQSDIGLLQGKFGPYSVYPQVCGHEIVGEITAVGSAVPHLKIGETVGVGAQRSSCMGCKSCSSGENQHCPQQTSTCFGGEKGGFADYIRVPSFFAFPIPKEIKPEHAGPLLCGGATVYSPISEHCAPGMKVAVVGIGGLGHLAVLFAVARGCETWAISTSKEKRAEALAMGARGFINSRDPDQLKAQADQFDVVLVTVSAALDWQPYLALLARRGKLVFVSAIPGDITVNILMQLVMKQTSVHGSWISGRRGMQEMLHFAAVHRIQPLVELYPFDKINEALQRVVDNKARYRVVLRH
eukprot:tig00020723_g13447.t1